MNAEEFRKGIHYPDRRADRDHSQRDLRGSPRYMPNGCQMYSLSGSTTKRTSVADRAPAKIRMQPNVGTLLAACRANKPGLKIRQANIIRPSIAADREVVAAPVVGAIDQQPAHT
jgi:hypothetical protein